MPRGTIKTTKVDYIHTYIYIYIERERERERARERERERVRKATGFLEYSAKSPLLECHYPKA